MAVVAAGWCASGEDGDGCGGVEASAVGEVEAQWVGLGVEVLAVGCGDDGRAAARAEGFAARAAAGALGYQAGLPFMTVPPSTPLLTAVMTSAKAAFRASWGCWSL